MKQVIRKPNEEFIFMEQVCKDKFYAVIHNKQIGFITTDWGKFIVKYVDQFITGYELSPTATHRFEDRYLKSLISGILNSNGCVYEFDTVKEMFEFIAKSI